jgi:hypothetical protein
MSFKIVVSVWLGSVPIYYTLFQGTEVIEISIASETEQNTNLC